MHLCGGKKLKRFKLQFFVLLFANKSEILLSYVIFMILVKIIFKLCNKKVFIHLK